MTREEEIEKAKKELADAEQDMARATRRKSEAQARLAGLVTIGLKAQIGRRAYDLLAEAVVTGVVLTWGQAQPTRDNAARSLQKRGFVLPATSHPPFSSYEVTDLGRQVYANDRKNS